MIYLEPRWHTEVLRILTEHLPADCAVWAFGSRVTGNCKPFSDLDLALLRAEPMAYAVLVALEHAFDDSLLPIKVDVVDFYRASESFRQIMTRQHVVLRSGC